MSSRGASSSRPSENRVSIPIAADLR